jgi:hypothetical protein
MPAINTGDFAMNHLPTPAEAIHGKAIDRACESDRAWFEANPNRLFRLRDMMPYESNGPIEAPPDGMSRRTLVVQVERGMRLRMIVSVPAELHKEEADDQQLASIFMPLAPKPFRKLLKCKLRKSSRK